jgi:hypothetical protein
MICVGSACQSKMAAMQRPSTPASQPPKQLASAPSPLTGALPAGSGGQLQMTG